MKHEWGNGELHTGFWLGDLRKRRYLQDLGIGWFHPFTGHEGP